MTAAFKLPSCMHYCVVELTQPLIDDSLLTLSSFDGLLADSENQPLTPIRQSRLMKGSELLFLSLSPVAPVTCPPGPRQFSIRFGRPDPTSGSLKADDGAVLDNEFPSSTSASSHRFAEKRLTATQPVAFGGLDMLDSPLHALNTILDSPNLIPKVIRHQSNMSDQIVDNEIRNVSLTNIIEV